jgi:hypothetical protein
MVINQRMDDTKKILAEEKKNNPNELVSENDSRNQENKTKHSSRKISIQENQIKNNNNKKRNDGSATK